MGTHSAPRSKCAKSVGRYSDPTNWLGTEDEQSDAGHEAVFDIDGDAQAVDQQPQVEYENI